MEELYLKFEPMSSINLIESNSAHNTSNIAKLLQHAYIYQLIYLRALPFATTLDWVARFALGGGIWASAVLIGWMGEGGSGSIFVVTDLFALHAEDRRTVSTVVMAVFFDAFDTWRCCNPSTVSMFGFAWVSVIVIVVVVVILVDESDSDSDGIDGSQGEDA